MIKLIHAVTLIVGILVVMAMWSKWDEIKEWASSDVVEAQWVTHENMWHGGDEPAIMKANGALDEGLDMCLAMPNCKSVVYWKDVNGPVYTLRSTYKDPSSVSMMSGDEKIEHAGVHELHR